MQVPLHMNKSQAGPPSELALDLPPVLAESPWSPLSLPWPGISERSPGLSSGPPQLSCPHTRPPSSKAVP